MYSSLQKTTSASRSHNIGPVKPVVFAGEDFLSPNVTELAEAQENIKTRYN